MSPRPRFNHYTARVLRGPPHNKTYREIAALLGVSVGAVYRACNEESRLAHVAYNVARSRKLSEEQKAQRRTL